MATGEPSTDIDPPADGDSSAINSFGREWKKFELKKDVQHPAQDRDQPQSDYCTIPLHCHHSVLPPRPTNRTRLAPHLCKHFDAISRLPRTSLVASDRQLDSQPTLNRWSRVLFCSSEFKAIKARIYCFEPNPV